MQYEGEIICSLNNQIDTFFLHAPPLFLPYQDLKCFLTLKQNGDLYFGISRIGSGHGCSVRMLLFVIFKKILIFHLSMLIRDGHADAGICGSCGWGACAQICGCGCGWKSHPHYPHINRCQNGNFLGQKWVSLALFSILSAQNINIVHTTQHNTTLHNTAPIRCHKQLQHQ